MPEFLWVIIHHPVGCIGMHRLLFHWTNRYVLVSTLVGSGVSGYSTGGHQVGYEGRCRGETVVVLYRVLTRDTLNLGAVFSPAGLMVRFLAASWWPLV